MTRAATIEENTPRAVPDVVVFARTNGISPSVAQAILDNAGGDIDKATEAVKRMKG